MTIWHAVWEGGALGVAAAKAIIGSMPTKLSRLLLGTRQVPAPPVPAPNVAAGR